MLISGHRSKISQSHYLTIFSFSPSTVRCPVHLTENFGIGHFPQGPYIIKFLPSLLRLGKSFAAFGKLSRNVGASD
ncbi:Hypothetical predicted protein [Cloeon dipterum]|uniref:Uncharacterized protein n=1 Tax=Cloeon dipterum TaxID=197152 RepID=A0A8S1CCP4_9INSE|nr:Hypothetical predicted protein [Cloeon dipterum]